MFIECMYYIYVYCLFNICLQTMHTDNIYIIYNIYTTEPQAFVSYTERNRFFATILASLHTAQKYRARSLSFHWIIISSFQCDAGFCSE